MDPSVGEIWQGMREQLNLVYNQTVMPPLCGIAIAVLGIALAVLPRNRAVLPLLAMACFLPSGPRLAFFELDFTGLRILAAVAWVRILLRREAAGFRWNLVDVLLTSWILWGSAAYVMLHQNSDALIYKLGGMFEAFGLYFAFRIFLRSRKDVLFAVRSFALMSIPTAAIFLIEHQTGRNLFALMGGVPEFTVERSGRLRCQGSFQHPIAAGCFWAALIPLMFSLFRNRSQSLALVGIFCGILIVVLSASSTPAAGLLASFIALFLIWIRRKLVWLLWAGGICLATLHLLMKAPIWVLVRRIDLVGGSTGYHRYMLIDQAIQRWDEWWLLGTRSTFHWGDYLFDVANQYVYEAVTGGMGALLLFGALILFAFLFTRSIWLSAGRHSGARLLAWTLGASFFSHCVIFIGLSYPPQNLVLWFWTVAAIGSLAPEPAPERAAAPLRLQWGER